MTATTPPAWVPCSLCEDFWCQIHDAHAHDCPCPGIEWWVEHHDIMPYDEGSIDVPISDSA